MTDHVPTPPDKQWQRCDRDGCKACDLAEWALAATRAELIDRIFDLAELLTWAEHQHLLLIDFLREPLHSLAEVADALGVTRQRVHQLVSSGRLPATRVGNTWVVRESDINQVRTH